VPPQPVQCYNRTDSRNRIKETQMKPDIQRTRLRQLPLFSEDIEVPRWQELNESTRKGVLRVTVRESPGAVTGRWPSGI
jgi:hypothetical protein